uniref:Uncharacterized protein n=1 Tax=Lotus japonicus TaxID=34305 RepID=I3T9N5_LOTJA|nr:unknown [Lotus japonicus]
MIFYFAGHITSSFVLLVGYLQQHQIHSHLLKLQLQQLREQNPIRSSTV